jgi:hypothetical protein
MKMNRDRTSTIITVAVALILLAALPWALLDTIENGRIYLFSHQFLDELPQRFSGPGRLRFVLQPLIAILLGCRGGLGDARLGKPPYLHGLLMGKGNRKELLRSGLSAIRNLVAMGIALDAVAQFLIYREVHPGAALVIGPVLICVPYALARALTNRVVGYAQRRQAKSGQ